ncbi:MAG: hypothetical protein JNN15_01710 [Blastocatellia bacterium]|nr:hypothetical protein [Blastocatellia bacterium]
MLKSIFSFLIIFLFSISSYSQERVGTVSDKSGNNFKVSTISFQFAEFPNQFKNVTSHIVTVTKNFEATIPISSLISIEGESDNYQIKYLYDGEERLITGKLKPGKFVCKSSFGNLELKSEKLKLLVFEQKPLEADKTNLSGLKATVEFTDGTKVGVFNIKVQSKRVISTSRVRGSADLVEADHFNFSIGDSNVDVDLKNIKEIEFQQNRAASVVIRTGESATGKHSVSGIDELIGIVGSFDKGEIFCSLNNVKKIVFD